jgi:hypothetical protein
MRKFPTVRQITIESRFFKNRDEWEYMLEQFGLDYTAYGKKITVIVDVIQVRTPEAVQP